MSTKTDTTKPTKARNNKRRADLVRGLAAGTIELQGNDVRLIDTYEDDHVICARVCIHGVTMAFNWCGPKLAGAAAYAHDSPQARADILKYLKTFTKSEGLNDDELGDLFAPLKE